MDYTLDATVDGDVDAVRARVVEALEAEGFGVMTEVDVQAAFDEQLGVEFRRYDILGACAPPLAHEALQTDPALGALLPCNVVVAETDDGRVVVRAVDPERLLEVADNDDLDAVAREVRERFERVLSAVTADGATAN